MTPEQRQTIATAALGTMCPYCGALPGVPCRTQGGVLLHPEVLHMARINLSGYQV